MSDFRLFERNSMTGDTQDPITNLFDYSVISSEGKKIGKVEEIWLNDTTGGEGFISVSTGWLFGRLCLIPVTSIQVDTDARVIRVPYTEETVKNAPDVAADYHVTGEEAMVVRQYYGIGDTSTHIDDAIGSVDTTSGARTDIADTPPVADVDVNINTTKRDLNRTRTDTTEIPLSEESVTVGKREVQAGTVRLRKVVRTEVVNQPVELRREDVVIDRVDASEAARDGESDFTEDEIDIPLTREEAVVQKTSQVTGAVRARKVSDTEQQNVSETVRKEDVEVERDADANIDRSTSTTSKTSGKSTGKNRNQ